MTEPDNRAKIHSRAQKQAELDMYAAARDVLENVRETQRRSGKSMRGGLDRLEPEVTQNITDTIDQSTLISALAESFDLPGLELTRLMESFEKTAKRRDITIPHHLRPTIYKMLATELSANIQHYNVDPKKCGLYVPVTMLHGFMGDLPDKHIDNNPKKPTYGEYFKTGPGIFHRVLTDNPGDPEGTLATVVHKMEDLPKQHIKGDGRRKTYGEYFGDSPGLFRKAALDKPNHTEGFLDSVVEHVEALPNQHIRNNPRNQTYGEYFADTPSILLRAAKERPTNPAKFLDGVVQRINRLPKQHMFNDPQLPTYGEFFAGGEGIFRKAAADNPLTPEDYLDGVILNIETLHSKHLHGMETNPTYGEFFEGSKGIFRAAAVHHSGSPEKFLDECAERVNKLHIQFPKVRRADLISASYAHVGHERSYLQGVKGLRGKGHSGGRDDGRDRGKGRDPFD